MSQIDRKGKKKKQKRRRKRGKVEKGFRGSFRNDRPMSVKPILFFHVTCS